MRLSKQDIIEKLKENADTLRKFKVKRIGIFGSSVRDEIKEDSDIDIVVEFKKGKATFKNVGGLIDFLENLFGKEIDLLTPDGIESIRIDFIKEKIKREVEYV
jgi:predicted nucleotidyltransferase